MYDVHYWPTPNGKKVTILLEELGVAYRIVPVNIGAGDQFTDEFLRMNPNHRMPVLVDNAPAGGGAPIAVFESGAIMQYLAEKHGRFVPADARGRAEVMQWVFWQMANQGPKLGELGTFIRAGDKHGDQSFALRRFTDEANRLYGVLNKRLYDRRYLAGDAYTIADMAALLRRWTTHPAEVAERASRLEWVLDGWDQLCLAWETADSPALRHLALREMTLMAPSLPGEILDWIGPNALPKNRLLSCRPTQVSPDLRGEAAAFRMVGRSERLRALLS